MGPGREGTGCGGDSCGAKGSGGEGTGAWPGGGVGLRARGGAGCRPWGLWGLWRTPRPALPGRLCEARPRLPGLWRWTQAHWALCPQAKMSPRSRGQPGIPAPAQRAPCAALRCQHPRTGRMPALPGALCAGQAATSLAAGQAAEGEQESEPKLHLLCPGLCPWVRLGTGSPFPPHRMGRGEDVLGVGLGEEPALAGGCRSPSARPVAVPGWPCLPSGGGWQPVGARVGRPGKALRRGISLAHASRSVSEPA